MPFIPHTADDIARTVKSQLSDDVAALYPQLSAA